MHRLLAIALALPLMLACLPRSTDRPYDQPIVCITFDDAHPTVWTNAFPCMRSVDTTYAATHFVPINAIDMTSAGTGITIAKLDTIRNA